MNDKLPPRFNIDTASMIVEFNASVWTARKLDRTATDEVIHNKNARAADAARVNKHLLAGRNELEVIQKFVAMTRAFVYEQTLPWSDNGQRLLPVTKFMEFEQAMDAKRQEFERLVGAFITIYPTLITAQAMALGDMFKREDFPSVQEITSKFAWSLGYLPVPKAGDFRVDVGNAAQKELQQKLEELSNKRVAEAHRSLWERLHEHLGRMADRLQVDKVGGEEKPRRFHDTLVTGGLELCDLLKSLNLTGDQELENARVRLEKTLMGVDADELRKNMDTRQHVAKEVKDMLEKMSW
jgi:hypothetical protein